MNKIFVFLLLAASLVDVPLSYAYSYRVVAIVNGESISNIQLKDRVNLVLSSSGIPDTSANRSKVTKEALEVLINETLQSQEAKAKGVEVSDSELEKAISDLEARNRIPAGSFKEFITSKGISYNATIDQIKAGVQWKKTVSRFFNTQIVISDAEIAAKKKEFAKIPSKRTANISEIIIPESFDDKSPTKDLVNKIIEDTRAGADFSVLAGKYSVGKTAKKGGAIGWIDEDKIVEPLASVVKKTKTGSVADPISTDGLYVLIRINDRKIFDPASDDKSIREAVLMQKMESQSKRYIKELRQKALIERKYKDISELIK